MKISCTIEALVRRYSTLQPQGPRPEATYFWIEASDARRCVTDDDRFIDESPSCTSHRLGCAHHSSCTTQAAARRTTPFVQETSLTATCYKARDSMSLRVSRKWEQKGSRDKCELDHGQVYPKTARFLYPPTCVCKVYIEMNCSCGPAGQL